MTPNGILSAVFVIFLHVLPANAQENPMHSPQNPDHWYPGGCCGMRDCEPTPIDAITETRDAWIVRYVSKKMGLIDEKVPKIGARNSQDGGFHGCWRPDETAKPRLICFFRPVNA
jgi:hypothetical protein